MRYDLEPSSADGTAMPEFISQWIRHSTWIVPLSVIGAAVLWFLTARAKRDANCTWCPWILFAVILVGLPSVVDGFGAWIAAPKDVPLLISLIVPAITFLSVDLALVLFAGPIWRRVRVFISFQHDREHQAREVENRLRAEGFQVLRLPFESIADHTALLTRVRHLLRHCDAVVCLPGARASFVEAEILAASAMNKLIIFVVEADSSRLPNTALYGYPVFRLQKLVVRQYRPLASLIKLACGGLAESGRLVGNVSNLWSIFPSASACIWCLVGYWLLAWLSGIFVSAHLGTTTEALQFAWTYPSALWGWLGTGVWWYFLLSAYVAGTSLLLFGLRNVRSTMRQTGPQYGSGFDTLRRSLGATLRGRRILVCLLRAPLQAEHDVVRPEPPLAAA